MTDDAIAHARARVLEAALPNVAFDGWSATTLREAIAASGVDAATARLAFPRGPVDLALAFHDDGDARLAQAMSEADLSEMRIRERVTWAVRKRLELVGPHREAVRRGAALLALPVYAADGAKAVWRTADTIWTGLGDASQDANWYSKRAILSGVYSATVLYWLGDSSDDDADTWAFLDRRIEGVMRFEKTKARVLETPLGRIAAAGPSLFAKLVRPPRRA